jgi:hypothetical protein
VSHHIASAYRRQRNPSVIVVSEGRPGQILLGLGPSLFCLQGDGVRRGQSSSA